MGSPFRSEAAPKEIFLDMYYYFAPAIRSYNVILVIAAVLPAVFLMLRVYRSDRLEKESPFIIRRLVVAGILSSLLALVEERVLVAVLDASVTKNYALYMFLLYFVIVAYAEETSKYLFLRFVSWRSPEFNCQYDGVVYAVLVSLGFALWENISYVMSYGFQTAILRALTAIPGHACFGVFMGVFYGMAKKYEKAGSIPVSRLFRVLSIVLPALLHGAYDYIASTRTGNGSFIAFIAVMFVLSYVLVGRLSRQDQHI